MIMKEDLKRIHTKLDQILEQVITNKVELETHKRIDRILYKVVAALMGFSVVMHMAEASTLIKFIL